MTSQLRLLNQSIKREYNEPIRSQGVSFLTVFPFGGSQFSSRTMTDQVF